jgi:hypothetical protein
MFKFDFDLDDEEPINQPQGDNASNLPETPSMNSPKQLIKEPFVEISLSQLVRAPSPLHPRISSLTMG